MCYGAILGEFGARFDVALGRKDDAQSVSRSGWCMGYLADDSCGHYVMMGKMGLSLRCLHGLRGLKSYSK
jgi:hypothetical protein